MTTRCTTHHRLQVGREPDPSKAEIRVAHIRSILLFTARGRRRPQIGCHGDITDTTDVERGRIHPYGAGQVSAKRIDEDLVLVELEDDVREPPELLPLERVAVASWVGRDSGGGGEGGCDGWVGVEC